MNCGICGREGATEKVSSLWVPQVSYLRCGECALLNAEAAPLVEAVMYEIGSRSETFAWSRMDPDLLEHTIFWRDGYIPVGRYMQYPLAKRTNVGNGVFANEAQATLGNLEVERLETLFKTGDATPTDYLRYVVGLDCVLLWDWQEEGERQERKRRAAERRAQRQALAVPVAPAGEAWDDTPVPWDVPDIPVSREPDTDMMQAFREKRRKQA